jgi:hypothetical protein
VVPGHPKEPQLAEQLNALAAKIDTATMTELNKRVRHRPGTGGQGGRRFLQASRPDLRRGHEHLPIPAFGLAQHPDLTLQHLELVGIAVSLAIAIGVPLGILMVRALA